MQSTKPLTFDDKREAFLAATQTFLEAGSRWKSRSKRGLTDEQLEEALSNELGIAGGRSSSGKCPTIEYQGAGLKIWASWSSINSYYDTPIYEGKETMAMARLTFNIADPTDGQMSLF